MPEVVFVVGPAIGKGGTHGGGGGTPVGKLPPIQVVGLVPMTYCDATECREIQEPCEFCNVVFATIGVPVSSYENDISSFLIDYALYASNPTATLIWKLQECTGGEWADLVTLSNNTYGTRYALNSIVNHPTYSGFVLNWAKVLQLQGIGIYRIKAQTSFGGVPGSTCLVSEEFVLRAWDCDRAHGTVKFETILSGNIGDINVDGKVFDLCTMSWPDSRRFPAFFGYEKTPEYIEVLHEYQNGLINRIRDEAVQTFELRTRLLPKTLHDRFKVYGLMADTLKVSDYNLNNSDYLLRQKLVVKNGAYEPEYYDRYFRRMAKVTVQFKEGIQGVIKSSCCDAERPVG